MIPPNTMNLLLLNHLVHQPKNKINLDFHRIVMLLAAKPDERSDVWVTCIRATRGLMRVAAI